LNPWFGRWFTGNLQIDTFQVPAFAGTRVQNLERKFTGKSGSALSGTQNRVAKPIPPWNLNKEFWICKSNIKLKKKENKRIK
jgi:hypothetical protein